jgi:hypothetical protein
VGRPPQLFFLAFRNSSLHRIHSSNPNRGGGLVAKQVTHSSGTRYPWVLADAHDAPAQRDVEAVPDIVARIGREMDAELRPTNSHRE